LLRRVVDEARVEAERDVVQEPALACEADVDAALLPVERGERCERVLDVEAEITRKVVPGAEGDADEGPVLVHGNAGDLCERPVSSRYAHRPRGLPRQSRRV